jgi:hypothetical protein
MNPDTNRFEALTEARNPDERWPDSAGVTMKTPRKLCPNCKSPIHEKDIGRDFRVLVGHSKTCPFYDPSCENVGTTPRKPAPKRKAWLRKGRRIALYCPIVDFNDEVVEVVTPLSGERLLCARDNEGKTWGRVTLPRGRR